MKKDEIVYSELTKLFPEAQCELSFKDEYTLLVSVILSAQCTDKRVNQVTPALFQKYPDVYALANAEPNELKEIIHSCGFYNSKAKSLIECCKDIVEKHNGKVPNTMEELIKLRGVGRKTANVVLSTAFGVPAIAVDTHVFRVSNRLGLSNAKDVRVCEKELMQVFPKERWSSAHHLMVLFGRYICKAQSPNCKDCPFKDICDCFTKKTED